MESVLFHELLHVVMADAPEENDDGIPDFLTIDESRVGIAPGAIYLSNDGTNPVDVNFGNITRMETISLAHIQVWVVNLLLLPVHSKHTNNAEQQRVLYTQLLCVIIDWDFYCRYYKSLLLDTQ